MLDRVEQNLVDTVKFVLNETVKKTIFFEFSKNFKIFILANSKPSLDHVHEAFSEVSHLSLPEVLHLSEFLCWSRSLP